MRTDQLILGHTLLIITARCEEQLLARTLAAICDITGAAVAEAVRADGTRRSQGSRELAGKIDCIDSAALRGARADALAALAAAGLPSALTARLGDTTIIIAAAVGTPLAADASALLGLLLAHAQAGRDRLAEIAALARRADRDPLTGLRHAGPFAERLDESSPGHTAIILLDLDEFKKINDQYGHQAGDRVLLDLVNALRAGLRGDDRLYRVGGDEFAVVVDVNGPDEVTAIARRLLDAARRAGQPISVGAAIHLAGESAHDTLDRADKALYDAKRSGRNTARLAAPMGLRASASDPPRPARQSERC